MVLRLTQGPAVGTVLCLPTKVSMEGRVLLLGPCMTQRHWSKDSEDPGMGHSQHWMGGLSTLLSLICLR